jgi:DNA-directed RNA polymerase subunit alpha
MEERIITISVKDKSDNHCQVEIINIPLGYGNIITHSLRRMLNLNVPSFAVSAFKVNGFIHEFVNIPGIQETTIQLISNIKSILFVMDKNNCNIAHTVASINLDKGVVKAKYIVLSDDRMKVFAPDQFICTLSRPMHIELFIT